MALCATSVGLVLISMERFIKNIPSSTSGNRSSDMYSNQSWAVVKGLAFCCSGGYTQSRVSWNCLSQDEGTFQGYPEPWGSVYHWYSAGHIQVATDEGQHTLSQSLGKRPFSLGATWSWAIQMPVM